MRNRMKSYMTVIVGMAILVLSLLMTGAHAESASDVVLKLQSIIVAAKTNNSNTPAAAVLQRVLNSEKARGRQKFEALRKYKVRAYVSEARKGVFVVVEEDEVFDAYAAGSEDVAKEIMRLVGRMCDFVKCEGMLMIAKGTKTPIPTYIVTAKEVIFIRK